MTENPSGHETDGAFRPPDGPTIRVLRGNPTPEELAAALAVVQARARATAAAPVAPAAAEEWSAAPRTVPRRVPAPGPDAWRTTYWPS